MFESFCAKPIRRSLTSSQVWSLIPWRFHACFFPWVFPDTLWIDCATDVLGASWENIIYLLCSTPRTQVALTAILALLDDDNWPRALTQSGTWAQGFQVPRLPSCCYVLMSTSTLPKRKVRVPVLETDSSSFRTRNVVAPSVRSCFASRGSFRCRTHHRVSESICSCEVYKSSVVQFLEWPLDLIIVLH